MTESDGRAIALNFSWLEGGLVAGCRGPRTERDLSWLAELGVRALVRLAGEDETGLGAQDVERHAIRDCYEPVRDLTPPSQDQLDRIIDFIKISVDNGEPVAVSCGAGQGRTGTVLACYLVAQGLSSEAAIKKLIRQRPCCEEILRVPGQQDAVVQFSRRTSG